MQFFQRPSNKLSNASQLQLTDIVCRMLSTDGEVSLEERIWMQKLCDNNIPAREMVGAMLCPDYVPHSYEAD